MIRIGANPICWSNDDMVEIGGDISLDQCLSEARDIGLEGMEKGNKFPNTAPALKAKLDEYGLVFVSGWYSTFLLERDAEAEFAAAEEELKLRRDAGAEVLVTCECTRTVHGTKSAPLSTRPVLTDAEWAVFLPRMTRFAELVRDFGLQLVYHHHMGTVVQTPSEVDRFMAGAGPAVKFLLDTGHITWAGGDAGETARTYAGRIGHVHTKDVREAIAARATEGGLVVSRCGARGRLHRPRRRLHRFRRRVQGAARLFRLDRDRGRAGPEKGQAQALRHDGL